MKKEIKKELLNHVIETINHNDLSKFDDLHYYAFNENHYIIGYYQCEMWLKDHEVSVFEAIEDIVQWDLDNFGEIQFKTEDINSEKIVNMYVYVLGEKLLSEFDLEQDKEDLLNELDDALEQLK